MWYIADESQRIRRWIKKIRQMWVLLKRRKYDIAKWQIHKPDCFRLAGHNTCECSYNKLPVSSFAICTKKTNNGDKKQYPCPESVCSYNQYMGGVDINDQLRQYYHAKLKTKNYKYLFWFIFDVAVTNAFILGRTNSQFKTVIDFRLKLLNKLLWTLDHQ